MLIAIVPRNPHAPSGAAYLPPSGRSAATLKNNIIVMDFLANVVMAGFVVCAPRLPTEAPRSLPSADSYSHLFPHSFPSSPQCGPLQCFPPSPKSHSHLSPVCHSGG